MIRRLRKYTTALGLLALSATLSASIARASPGSASRVVIKTSSAHYELAQLIEEATTITLEAGETLTLLAADGKSHTVTGPFEGSAAAVGGENAGGLELTGAIASVLVSKTGDLSAVAASRDVKRKPKRADGGAPAWRFTLGPSGSQCAIAGEPPTFWRSHAEVEVGLAIREVEHGRSAELTWAAGEHELAWPDSVPAGDGATYLVEVDGTGEPTSLVLHEIPGEAAAGIQGVAFLLSRGCDRQAKQLWAEYQQGKSKD
jgi:hypothetical protein